MAAKKKPPRLKDIMIKPPYPSKHIPITHILGDEVVVTDFHYIPSQFPDRLDYLAIQVRFDHKRRWFTTSSSYIIDFFERVSPESLPCRATFVLERDEKGGRTYNVK